jgi:hypothetical protein
MQHPVNSFHDLAFIIRQYTIRDEIPPKFLVFFNSRTEAQAGAEFLHERLAPELCDKVKWEERLGRVEIYTWTKQAQTATATFSSRSSKIKKFKVWE